MLRGLTISFSELISSRALNSLVTDVKRSSRGCSSSDSLDLPSSAMARLTWSLIFCISWSRSADTSALEESFFSEVGSGSIVSSDGVSLYSNSRSAPCLKVAPPPSSPTTSLFWLAQSSEFLPMVSKSRLPWLNVSSHWKATCVSYPSLVSSPTLPLPLSMSVTATWSEPLVMSRRPVTVMPALPQGTVVQLISVPSGSWNVVLRLKSNLPPSLSSTCGSPQMRVLLPSGPEIFHSNWPSCSIL